MTAVAGQKAKMNPAIRHVLPENQARVLSELPYWLDDAKWAKVAEVSVGERGMQKVYLAKIIYAWERAPPHVQTTIIYGLFTQDDFRPDVADYVGGLEFATGFESIPEGRIVTRDSASVVSASIEPAWRGMGLGKFMYKGAINDLLHVEGVSCVRSDVHRSIDAERVWASICRTAEGRVYTVPHRMGAHGIVYETRGPVPIRRRPQRPQPLPVRVKKHVRRRTFK